MNQLFGQPPDVSHSGDGDLGPASVPVRPLPVGGAEQAFFHLDIKRSLQLHWRLARNVAIAGAVLALAYFLVQTLVLRSWPAYEAESQVSVPPTQSKVYEPGQGGAPRWPYDNNTYETYIQQQMMNVTRNDVLTNALKKLGDFQQQGESQQAAVQRLVQALLVVREGNAYQFSIFARAKTADFAADIANDVTAAYLESITRDQKTGDSQRLAMLSDERDRITKALDADRTEQEELNKQLGVASVGNAVPDHFDEDITSTRVELIKARTEHDAAEAKFAALDAGHGPSSSAIDAAADEMIANDAGLISMKTSLNQRRATLISQMANLTPSHPQYKQDEVELGKINTELDTMLKDLRAKAAARIQLQLQSELQRTAGVESEVNGQLRKLVGAAGSATPKMQRSSDLATDIARLQARYASVDEQLHNLTLEDNAPAPAFQVTRAAPPLNRTKTGVLRNVLLILFAGLAFGLFAAVLAHKLDPKVYVAKDVELVLGFAPMALLPDFDEVPSGVADEYLLRLASSIEHARKQSQLRSCVFTGTSAGNGVTTLVSRVGGFLEAMGRPILLVDASGAPAPDARPHTNRPDNTPGLVPLDRASRPTALLQQMVEETETQDETLVLTDTAPLPVSAETEYLARFVDCAIVVIQSGKTTRRELREVAANLQRLDVAAVGFVLNRVGLEKADPAFRDSVKAIQKHQESQKTGQIAYAAEPTPSHSNVPLWPASEPQNDPVLPREGSSRSHFEAELVAASAAVERFSHPASPQPDAEACLPSPTVPVPVAESAVRFVAEQVAASSDHGPSAPPEEVPVAVQQTQPAETDPQRPLAPKVAPYVDAAQQASAGYVAHPVSHHSPADQALFTALGGAFLAPASAQPEDATTSAPSLDSEPEPYQLLFTHAESGTPVVAVHEPHLQHEETESPYVEPVPQAPQMDWLKPEPVAEVHLDFPAVETVPEPEAPAKPDVLAEAVPGPAQETVEAANPPILPAAEVRPSPNSAWWHGDLGGQRAAKRAPILWKPAKVRVSMSAPEGSNAPPPQSEDRSDLPHSFADAPSEQTAQPHEPAEPLSSRLSGLRSLLFVLGVKEAQNPVAPGERQAGHEPDVEAADIERSVDRMDLQDRNDVPPTDMVGASPRLVTAPYAVPMDPGRETPHASEPQVRPQWPAASDDIETLPARHGQYKNG